MLRLENWFTTSGQSIVLSSLGLITYWEGGDRAFLVDLRDIFGLIKHFPANPFRQQYPSSNGVHMIVVVAVGAVAVGVVLGDGEARQAA
ncbi:hypothetical protein DOTSEDRAFT_70805 [Dothistroma septosporum NZE10]|uniref:Uncharacterized protein n=1 Tax=Dothistroma septosporum (strain NZE10 / CBS 128990) TaxID=675120 RepID=N1PNA0_DOTSN|nr:hypothetical protein DOTSEDRAFT_70805 [Dothistroma septosporum NZE10]